MARANDLSWNNRWIEATPIYQRVEQAYTADDRSKALYAHVSQFVVRAESEPSLPLLRELSNDLTLPEAKADETHLRILEIRGIIETNYDAGMARSTWATVQTLARDQHRYLLMARAMGEQGIAAFLLGDLAQARKQVLRAWLAAKYLGDDAAHVRYASVYGAGLVELQRYGDAVRVLDEAIDTARKSRRIALPTIAINSKIDALRGLGQYDAAMVLADEAVARLPGDRLDAHLYQILTSKGEIYEDKGDRMAAVRQYGIALNYARHLRYWRGVVQTGGLAAEAYLHQGHLIEALQYVDEALNANNAIPEELYFSPRNLAIKAKILDALGRADQARLLHRQSLTLLDSLLATAPTPEVERELLTELRRLYSDYFDELCQHGQYAEAFSIIERARGRIEAQALSPRQPVTIMGPSERDERLTRLDITLIEAQSPAVGQELEKAVLDSSSPAADATLSRFVALRPMKLKEIQAQLASSEVVLEYVLDEPSSSVLVITATTVARVKLGSGSEIQRDASSYRRELEAHETDVALSHKLFKELLGVIPEYRYKADLIVVPDGQLHLLPFSTLSDGDHYVVMTHNVSVSPSASVLAMLRNRSHAAADTPLQFAGVGASNISTEESWIATIFNNKSRGRAPTISHTEDEVRSVAHFFAGPATILVGRDATKTRFQSLPLDQYRVLHLALHGYANTDASERSALLFEHQDNNADDGLLHLSEIEALHLRASLVTLSACDTGVGPVNEIDVDNLGNAFIEAGAQSVVTSLWDVEDLTSARLMEAFYKRLNDGKPKTEALREAQLEIIKAGLPPFYWGSVELLGDPSGSIWGKAEDENNFFEQAGTRRTAATSFGKGRKTSLLFPVRYRDMGSGSDGASANRPRGNR
jgi:CHAT domain-containing protein